MTHGPRNEREAYDAGEYGIAKNLLLEEYARKPVRRLLQFDGHVVGDEGDYIMRPDEDGHCVLASVTHELLNIGGTPDLPVRVLIHEDANKEQVLILLEKIADWVERDFYRLRSRWGGRSDPDAPS